MAPVNSIAGMKISPYLQPGNICLSLTKTEKNAALREVAELLKSNGSISDFETFFNEVLERERISNTALGHEVVLPHARTDQVTDIVLAVGRFEHGVDFGAQDHQPVKFIILIGTPKKMVTDYLRLVGALARLMKQDAFRTRLADCRTPAEFIAAFKQMEGN
jgi:mannitol/fructose-specific phosphotransferase system IIA component (Ntr-type)